MAATGAVVTAAIAVGARSDTPSARGPGSSTTTTQPSNGTTAATPTTSTTQAYVPPRCGPARYRLRSQGAHHVPYHPFLVPELTQDAQGATWTNGGNDPITVRGGEHVCWVGGTIVGPWNPVTTSWADYHHSAAFEFANANFTVKGIRVDNYGDGVRMLKGANQFTVTGVHLSGIHDDCVEDDPLGAGSISDSLFDGCYVGFSARPPSYDSKTDGRANTVNISNSLIRLQAMPTVFKGPAPGHGGFFKWDDHAGRSPKLALYHNVFRVDQLPNHGSLGLPAGYAVSCADNTVVWLGAGPFPVPLPSCFQVTTDRGVWDRAVALWRKRHSS